MGQITLHISDNLIKKLPKNQSDIEQVLKLGLDEYGVKQETSKRVVLYTFNFSFYPF